MELKGLKIGRRFYKVKRQYLPKDYGRVNLNRGVIRIDDPQPPFVVADATLHEILHAIWADRRLPERPTEERVVTALAQGLVTVLYENPRLLAYIDGLLKEVHQGSLLSVGTTKADRRGL
jgi:hypothetical protein